MSTPIDRDDFSDDLLPRQPTSREINYFPIDDMKAAFIGAGYILTQVKNFIQNRIHGPSLLDQMGEVIFPRY